MAGKTTIILEKEGLIFDFKKLLSEYVSKNSLVTKDVREESRHPADPNTKRLLLYLFTATRGSTSRIRIILKLAERPQNVNQLAKDLNLEYRAVKHHIDILEKNNLISHFGEKYGMMYTLSTFLEYNIDAFNDVVVKLYNNLQA